LGKKRRETQEGRILTHLGSLVGIGIDECLRERRGEV